MPDAAKKLAPSRAYVEGLLKTVGAPVSPKEIGIDRDLFYQSLLDGYKVRDRYSVLDLAVEQGKMQEIAEKITHRFYDED